MLHHLNSNLSNVQSLKSFQHLLHQREHPNLDLHILTFPKNLLVSTVSTPKISLTVFLGGCRLQVQQLQILPHHLIHSRAMKISNLFDINATVLLQLETKVVTNVLDFFFPVVICYSWIVD